MFHLLETASYVYILSHSQTLKIEKGTPTSDISSIISVQDTPNRHVTLRMLKSANHVIRESKVHALLGFLRFSSDWYVVVVTKVKELGVFGICEIQEIEKVRIDGSSEFSTIDDTTIFTNTSNEFVSSKANNTPTGDKNDKSNTKSSNPETTIKKASKFLFWPFNRNKTQNNPNTNKPLNSNQDEKKSNPSWGIISSLFGSNQLNAIEKKYHTIFKSLEMNKGFYFSHSYQLHCTLQHNATSINSDEVAVDALRKRSLYVWNSGMQYLDGWCVPLIHGYCGVTRLNIVGKYVVILIISRRSRVFAGTRYLKRGLQDSGHVANHVETEQIVLDLTTLKGKEEYLNGSFSSFVQIRGSIPVFWSQRINKKVVDPKPEIVLGKFDPLFKASRKHFNDLIDSYGKPVICLDLLKKTEKKPRETLLGEAYSDCIKYINQFLDDDSKIQYTSWDFKESTKGKPDVFLNELTAIAEESLETTSFFFTSPFSKGKKVQLQNGVLRTNCLDCLDRTNIAQFFLAKHVLGNQLYKMGIIDNPHLTNYNSILESVMFQFQKMGDYISMQYGGSATVSAGVNHRGFTWDVITSAQRYYSNNFIDTTRQHAINLFLQNFKYTPHGLHVWEIDTEYDEYLDFQTESTFRGLPSNNDKSNLLELVNLPYLDKDEIFSSPIVKENADRNELLRSFEGRMSRGYPLECSHITELKSYVFPPSFLILENNTHHYEKYLREQDALQKFRDFNKMVINQSYEEKDSFPLSQTDKALYEDYCNIGNKFIWKRRNDEYIKSQNTLMSLLEQKISPDIQIHGEIFKKLSIYFPTCISNEMIYEQVDAFLNKMEKGLIICDRVRLPRINSKTFQSLFHLVQGRIYRRCFLGSRAVDWILKQKNWTHLSRKEAIKLMELLQEGEMIHHVVFSEMPFRDDFNLYRMDKHNPTRILNMEFPYTRQNEPIDPCKLSALLVGEITSLFKILTPNPKKWSQLHTITISETNKLLNNPLYIEYQQNATNLRSINITMLNSNQLKCFFINIYNALFIHCVLIKGTARVYQKSMHSFCSRMCYNVAGKLFSLTDIREGILGGNQYYRNAIMKPFQKNDPRLMFVLEEVDPRIKYICPYSNLVKTPILLPETMNDILEEVASNSSNSLM